MALKIMTPDEIWRDFKTDGDFAVSDEKVSLKADSVAEHTFTFVSETVEDGDISVYLRCLVPEKFTAAAIVVEDYKKPADAAFLSELLKSGLAVIVPDYSDRYKKGTAFTPLTSYLSEENRGERLYEIKESAKDSCQVMYARIIRRAAGLIKSKFGAEKFLYVSLGDAAEVAVQCAATDKRTCGLLMLNGFGYSEFNDLNVFGETKEVVYDEKTLGWMSGVSAVAYTRYIKCPVMVAIGTNSKRCDMDRLSGFTSRMESAEVCAVLSAGARDTLDYESFRTIKNWLARTLSGAPFPRIPEIKLFVNRDGAVYAEAAVDTSAIIESVEVFYSSGEYNRRFRGWKKVAGVSISDAGFMAAIPVSDPKAPVFAYVEARYIDGTSVSSYVAYLKTDNEKVKNTAVPIKHIVVESGRSFDSFAIDRDADVTTSPEKLETLNAAGLKGVASEKGGLLTFAIAEAAKSAVGEILQIDLFTKEGATVEFELETFGENGEDVFSAAYNVPGSERCFSPVRLTKSDFKNADLKPLDGWKSVKSLKVLTAGVAVGNIIFV